MDKSVEEDVPVQGSTTLAAAENTILKEVLDKQESLVEGPAKVSLPEGEATAAFQEDVRRQESALEQYRKIQEQSFPDLPIITGQQLLKLVATNSVGLEKGAVLVDCRSDAERKVSIIPGAVGKAEIEGKFYQFADKEVIGYCAIGRRSGNFLNNLLKRHPQLKVLNLAGSLVDWVHLGGPLVDGVTGAPTTRLDLGGNSWLPYLPTTRKVHLVTEAT